MPVADIDGTKYKVAKSGEKMGKTFSDRSEKDLKATFKELAKVYGSDAALKMVKDNPLVLAASRKNFQPSLKAFAKNFGEEDAKAMVQRNPGLLFLKPTGAGGADSADNLTMRFSYVVAFTRPVGPFLLYGLLFALATPALEAVTGVPIRETLFGVLNK